MDSIIEGLLKKEKLDELLENNTFTEIKNT